MKKFIATVLVAFSTVASAANWVEVDASADMITSVDTDSLRRPGNKVWAWIKQYNSTLQKSVTPGKMYRTGIALMVYDCDNKTVTLLQDLEYADIRDVVYEIIIPEKNRRADEIVPGTIGETILKFVCKKDGTK